MTSSGIFESDPNSLGWSQEEKEILQAGETTQSPSSSKTKSSDFLKVGSTAWDGANPGLIQHAKRELALLGEEKETVDGYLAMLQIFAQMGHSGGSASVFIPTLVRLLSFQNLKPLTNSEDEWVEVTDHMWQNNRNSEAFSHDGGHTYELLSERDGNMPGSAPLHVALNPGVEA